jgi:hypothetical protein
MMQSTTGFIGLTMPVFTAFGWTGEDNALKFALSQLEEFIIALHGRLPHLTADKLPSYGLSEETQSVYLAASADVESDLHIVFNARPMSFEIQMVLKNKEVLAKAWKRAGKDLVRCHRLITELGPEWTLRVQQMEVDENSGEAANYQDLFKDTIDNLDEETAASVIGRAAYLNGEEQWVTPVYLSHRIPSERAAAMGPGIVDVMSEQVANLMPLISFLTGRVVKTKARAKAKPVMPVEPAEPAEPVEEEEIEIDMDEGFVYTSELKPLHLRRGFVNMTSEHWPFFASNSRATTREVTVYYDGIYDKDSTVWRLVPNDQARLVLSPTVHQWLEDQFGPNDQLVIVAKKLSEEEIQLSLKAA